MEQSVCEQRGGQTQPTDRIGMHAGRVEWNSASRSVELNSRTEANTVPSGAEWTSDKTAIGQRRLEQKDERRINDPN